MSTFYILLFASFPLLFEEIARLILTLDKRLVDMKGRFDVCHAKDVEGTSDNDTLTTLFELTTRNQPISVEIANNSLKGNERSL